jgi:outer membrane phospholipase A
LSSSRVRRAARFGAVLIAALGLTPSMAAVRTLVDSVEPAPDGATVRLRLAILNASDQPVDHALPATLPVDLTLDGRVQTLDARLDAASPARLRIAPHGFGEASYVVDLPSAHASSTARIALNGGQSDTAFVLAGGGAVVASQVPAAAEPPVASPELAAAGKPVDERVLGNFSAYAPIYLVYGPGASSSDTRIQISLKYQLFGSASVPVEQRSWIDNIYVAYTQRMFADVNLPSNPFRAIDFQPELFYLFRPKPIGEHFDVGGQVGVRHLSNGKGGLDSRSYNSVYVKPDFGFTLGSQRLTLSPTAWFYFAKDTNNPDIAHYRGYSGLSASLGSERGLMLTADSRYSFGSGKGAVDATLSYPLSNIFGSRVNLYLFGQAFTGYGESLFEYDRKITRARIGIGLTR